MNLTTIDALLLSIAMAAAAGLVGAFAVMRRMTLAADALSHVALPGIGIALALHVHPLFGAVSMLAFGGLLVWALEERTRLATETVVGVVFSAALAVGSMITSGEDLIEALLGRAGPLSPGETIFGVSASLAVIAVILRARHRLVLTVVSPDIARTVGIRVSKLDLLFLEVFALTVALGLRYLGVLLMGSLVIIPAATAKRLSRNLDQMLMRSVVIAAGVTLAGAMAGQRLHRETGPLIVVFAAIAFLLSLTRPQA